MIRSMSKGRRAFALVVVIIVAQPRRFNLSSALGDERADKEAGGHAGEAEEKGSESDLVSGLEGWQAAEGGLLGLEAAFLHEVEEAGYEG